MHFLNISLETYNIQLSKTFSLLYSPLENLSFLKCANNKFTISNSTSLLFKSTFCLYFWLLSCSCFWTYSCNACIVVEKSSALAFLVSTFPKFLNSQIPLGCMPYTIWNGLKPMLLLGESLYANSSWRSAWSHCFGSSLTKFSKCFPNFY